MSNQRIASGVSSPAEAERPRPRRRKSRPFFIRAVLLLVWLIALDLWAVQHLGLGLSEPGLLGLVVTSYTAAAALVERLAGKAQMKRIAERFLRPGRLVFEPPVLILLYLSLALVALSYSSVLVLTSEGKTIEGVRLVPLVHESPVWHFGEPRRLVVYSGPLGQPFRLNVPGYLPAILPVPPLRGARVVPERDLRRPLTLLLRPPVTALGALQDEGARLQLDFLDESGSSWRRHSVVCPAFPCRQRSYLIGRWQRVPSDLLGDWRLEVLASGYPDGAPQLWRSLVAWKEPHRMKTPLPDLIPGRRLRAVALSGGGVAVAWAEVTLGEEDFQDIQMTKE